MMPPAMPAAVDTKASAGVISTMAMMRGATSTSIGFRPSVFMASISWRIFIVPICAVKEELVRPARTMPVSTTPNSRSIE